MMSTAIPFREQVPVARPEVFVAAASIDLTIHDASRLEWTAVVPLDVGGYELAVELEIPANAVVHHAPWAHLQSLVRLETPDDASPPAKRTLEGLRRYAASVACGLAWSSVGFARHCERAKAHAGSGHGGCGGRYDLPEGVGPALRLWFDSALERLQPARTELARLQGNPQVEDDAVFARECALVDEYWSTQLVHMLTGASEALRDTRDAMRPRRDVERALRPIEEGVFEALAREMQHRKERGYLDIEEGTADALERYVGRSSLLKKHFQEALFLDFEGYQVHERMHGWVSSFVAILAGMWAFAWQVVLLHGDSTSRMTWGFVLIAMFAGIIYATREKIKEVGRAWIEGRVHRFYAQRVARYRSRNRVVVSARESFDRADGAGRTGVLRPDASGFTLIRFVHHGKVHPAAKHLGVGSVREIFRYDISPVFAWLHDDVKPIAFPDPGQRSVRVLSAPRVYRFPARIKLTAAHDSRELHATIVVNKKGLVRIERS
ncbi:hypothetical protein LVJ94_06430 [Pendulispora rubella]|uniref:Uncharacterized protein n=1 Tax=Pendulispora rubella TaxID=2741070 RepID=A0ABZ2LCG3_9BACT